MTLFTRSGSRRYAALAELTTWFKSTTGGAGAAARAGAVAGNEGGAGVGAGVGGGVRSFSMDVISEVATSVKLESSAEVKSRVFSPITMRWSWRMVNPLLKIAMSVADAAAARTRTAATQRSAASIL